MKLYEPMTVGGIEFKNRVVWAPMISLRADGRSFVTDDTKELYLKIAKSGVGMLVIEATCAMAPVPSFLSLSHDSYIPKFKEMVDQIHSETEAKVYVQIYEPLPGYFGVHDVPPRLLQYFIKSFIKAGVRAQQAGIDGVEIHGAHAYWIANFLSIRNKRKDEYGGNLTGRLKIVKDITEGIQKECGKDYPVGIRINADDFLVGGNTLKQTTKMAPRLAEMGMAYISVSAGGKYQDTWGPDDTMHRMPYPMPGPWNHYKGYSGHRTTPAAYMPDATNVYLAEAIKDSIEDYDVPVITAGKIPTTDLAEKILQKGKADLIGICRPILCDFDWLIKSQEGRQKEIVKCAYCLTCMERARLGRTECIKWSDKNPGC